MLFVGGGVPAAWPRGTKTPRRSVRLSWETLRTKTGVSVRCTVRMQVVDET